MNKKILIPVVAVALLGTTVFGVSQVSAQDTATGRINIVQRLASTFGLNEADVQSVFDQQKTERQAEMQANFETRLSEKVTNGSLSEDQKQLILAKHNELQAQREDHEPGEMRDMTAEERQAEREEHQTQHDELQSWADANGIDIQDLMEGMGRDQGGRMGGRGMGNR